MNRLVQDLKNVLSKNVVENKNIVVVGDLMLDEYIVGDVERISPEAPVPVIKEKDREFSYGGAANVAINCKHVNGSNPSAGCNTAMIGIVGDRDEAGKRLISMLCEKNINIEGIVKSPDRVTTCKKRVVSQQQQLLRIDAEETHKLTNFERDSLICNIHTVIKPGSLIVISDYAKGVIDRQIVEEVIARAKVCNATIVVDPKGPHFDKYVGVHYLKPNLKEFYQMVDFFGLDRQESVLNNGRAICTELQLKGLVVTMGDKGLQFVAAPESTMDDVFYTAHKREVYDITGAGDTVLAFLAVGLACDFSMHDSLKIANLAASVAVSHHKTYAVGVDELLNGSFRSDDKIYTDWKSLKQTLDWLRSEKKKKIVFTNGCFDLLHSGHIFLLQEAKRRGDILVVALNVDESVKRYKGDNRPIKPIEERVKIIAAIDVVDYVVCFDQDTPYKLIDCLRPDVLVKGGDYQLEKIVGYDLITDYGGEVQVVEYQDGFSTTNLVKNIQETE